MSCVSRIAASNTRVPAGGQNDYLRDKAAWDHAVTERTNPHTLVVAPEQNSAARHGTWHAKPNIGTLTLHWLNSIII